MFNLFLRMGLTCPSLPAAYARTGKIKHFCGISYPIGKFLRKAQYATRRSDGETECNTPTRRSGGKAECNGALETPESYNDSACPFRGCREATGIRKNHPHAKRGARLDTSFCVRMARLELAQEKLPLPPQSSASTISPHPL